MHTASDPLDERSLARAAQALSSRSAHVTAWRGLTAHGNRAFEGGRDVDARQLYEQALEEAEAIFAAALIEADPESMRLAPLLYWISCNDIAQLARRQGDDQTSGIFLFRAFERLVRVAEAERSPLELRSRCALHLNVVTSALAGYLLELGSSAKAEAFIERSNRAINAVQRLEQAAQS
jgi:hypothetical protein